LWRQAKTKNADLSGFGKKKTSGKGGGGSSTSDERRMAKKEADRLAAMEVRRATRSALFECWFPYVCPEPVLVNDRFFMYKWPKKPVSVSLRLWHANVTLNASLVLSCLVL
jgi:hypothetical protein